MPFIIRLLSLVFILFIILPSQFFPQIKSNLEIFYSLADSSAREVILELPKSSTEIDLELNTGSLYSIFNTQIISALNSAGIKISSNGNNQKVIFVVDNASVEYDDMFRDGFLGAYLTKRIVKLEGNYFVAGSSKPVNKFLQTFSDTIRVDEINEIENFSFPFTKGEIPPEPFFTGLFEPVVAIGTAAAAVILFFTIRSK